MKTFPFLLLLMSFVVGCSSTDVSRCEPFSSYVGETVELQYPVAVVEKRSMRGKPGRGVQTRHNAEVGLKAARHSKASWFGYATEKDRILATLPVGHQVRIDRVVDEVFIDGKQIVAYGQTILPSDDAPVTFAYAWGFLSTLQRAPWEPEDVPNRREFGGDGRR